MCVCVGLRVGFGGECESSSASSRLSTQIRKRMMKEEDRKEEVDRLGGGCTTPTHVVQFDDGSLLFFSSGTC